MLLCPLGFLQPAFSQCPSTDFSVEPTACQSQTIQSVNASGPGSYLWDFCSGDFQNVPSAQLDFTLAGVNGRPGLEFVQDGTKWFAFVTGTFSNILYRLEFDNGLAAAPTATVNLGSLGGVLNQPGQIRIIKEGTQWYGILHNTSGELVKFSFGNQLTNPITSTSLITGIGSTNAGLFVGKDPVHGWVCVVSSQSNQFVMIRLGNFLSIPNPITDVVTSAQVPNPSSLGDVDITNVCGNWIGIANNLGNGNVYQLDFGPSLFSAPAINQLSFSIPGNPGRLRIAKEGEEYYVFIIALDGTLTKLNFGNNIMTAPAVVNEGNIGGVLPPSMYGLGLVKENSVWTILGVNQANGQIYRILYPDICSAAPKTSALSNPSATYSLAGTYSISLETISGNSIGSKTRTIVVSALTAPDINFNSQNNCALNNVLFTAQNASGNVISYSWNFDDTQTSLLPNPAHSYTAAGTYDPRLTVVASNGCSNTITKPLTIYNLPVSDFALPALSPICTNQNYQLTNSSSFDPASNPTWEWRINGTLISTQQHLNTAFSAAPQELRLKALIPGCENETIKNIATVLPGPAVDFTAGDDCAESLVSFSNTTTGTVSGYTWNFGDGSPSSALPQPTHNYTNAGVFQVALTASNLAGCQNQVVKSITIYSLPQPDFSVGLPPFSCSNTPTPFQNNTPALTDSNIIDWAWSFGDASGSTSANQSPSFTYTVGGNYSVDLTATSDFGCAKTLTKLVAIGSSPLADFTVGPSCLNKPTAFTDISSGGVQSRIWQISSSSFAVPNPTYTFTSPGNFAATLTVTGMGGCSNMVSKAITVPVAPSLAFATSNPCADQAVGFSDVTSSPADPVIGWNWNADGNSITGNPAEHIFPNSGVFNVKMTTTHASGCTYTLSNNISIHPSPTAVFIPLPDRGAAPLTVQFENASLGATQYQWMFRDKIQSTSTDASPVYTFIDLGEYSAELTAINSFGCRDTLTVPISVLIPSIDLAITDFSLTTDPVTGNLKSIVTILNNSNIPLENGEVALHLSDNAVVNETLVLNLSPGQSSTQMLSFTISPAQLDLNFVCAAVLSEKDIQPDNNKRCLSLADGDHVFAPYPNPSSGTLQIDWISEAVGSARITVYNSMGKREYEWETPSAVGLNQSVHDLAFLSAGMYYVTIQTSASVQTMRFLRL